MCTKFKLNIIDICGDVLIIHIKDRFALTNKKYYDLIKDYTWYFDAYGYVLATVVNDDGTKKVIRMHRLIKNCPDNMEIDHIDHNKFNNMEQNLRICTHKENMQNIKPHSKFKTTREHLGVYFNKEIKKWIPYIYAEGHQKSLGSYADITEAIKVRKEAELEYYGYEIEVIPSNNEGELNYGNQ